MFPIQMFHQLPVGESGVCLQDHTSLWKGLNLFLAIPEPRCISNQYTASGYLISDINLFYIILISTYFFIIIAGMIVTHTLNL